MQLLYDVFLSTSWYLQKWQNVVFSGYEVKRQKVFYDNDIALLVVSGGGACVGRAFAAGEGMEGVSRQIAAAHPHLAAPTPRYTYSAVINNKYK